MSLTARLVLVLTLVVSLLAGWWRLTAYFEGKGYTRAQAEYQAAAELRREANRAQARKAETAYFAQAQVREKFIVQTVREIVHDTENLRACVLTPAARGRLLDVARCVESGASSCGTRD